MLRKENYSMRAIAKHLNLSVSTIFREINCNMNEESYSTFTAQTQYKTKKRRCSSILKLDKFEITLASRVNYGWFCCKVKNIANH